jgi:hypothetical protein
MVKVQGKNRWSRGKEKKKNSFRIRTLIFAKLEMISIIRSEDKSVNSHRGSDCVSWSRSLLRYWGNRRLFTVLTGAGHWPLSWATRIEFRHSPPICLDPFLVLIVPFTTPPMVSALQVCLLKMYNSYSFPANMFSLVASFWQHSAKSQFTLACCSDITDRQ